MSNKSNLVFQACCFFIGRLCCHTRQFSVVRSEKHVLIMFTFSKHIARLRGMFHVNNTASCAERLPFPKGYCSFERKVRHVHSFRRNTSYVSGIFFLQKRAALFQRVCCMSVLIMAFVGRYGYVALILKTSSLFCRTCVLLKGHCSIYLR